MHFKAKLATAVLVVSGVLGGLSLAAPAMAATAQPVITSLTPNEQVAGNTIVIHGAFADPIADITVQFGTQTPAAPTSVTPTSILVTVPPEVGHHGTVAIRVIDSAAFPTTSAATGQSEFVYDAGTGIAQNVFSDLYLSASGFTNGSHVVQSALSRVWTLRANGEIVDSASGRCLDVTAMSKNNGAHLQLWDCNGTPNQLWRVKLVNVPALGDVEIINRGSHKCVDDTGYSHLAGAIQQQWTCNGTDNQYFSQV
jgi:Ricin-type beta-trefoil lectin domain-like/IPT/TIG domain